MLKLKCVCGHSDYDIGSEQFKPLYLDKEDCFVTIDTLVGRSYYLKPTKIYACAICGTLKIDV